MNQRVRGRNTVRLGIVGTALAILLTLVATNVSSLPILSAGSVYSGVFRDTGGLAVGGDVEVAGIVVGTVSAIQIDADTVIITFTIDGDVELRQDARLSIPTQTVLGTKNLRIEPGTGEHLSPGARIALDNTTSPYQLTDALGDLTDDVTELDTDGLTEAMRVSTDVLEQTPADLAAAVDGVGRLSQTIASRDKSLRSLLATAEQVTGVLATRSEQIDTLIVDADTILGELNRRRAVVDRLFDSVTALAQNLSGLVAENEGQLGSTLTSLNSVLDVLEENRANIGQAIENLSPYITQLGEAVSSGPFFNSYIQNLIPGQVISPFIRAALGLGPAPGESASVNPFSVIDGAPR
ncbi:MlaD family protein [Rhodococcus sp. IEGM 1381]|uniref:MCE family protein n=1 Tax=Rhodococcus sp. IEGM 1381 TaxID=3047085 RepID=UPI0024B78D5B|nr:MlaD family protein [Rhodococcus sp. IEGM 1381]MDI9896862.1 MlaD family protein [Rhodococcus sp. IEGM 1381]